MKPELSFPEFNREWDYNLFSEIVTNKSKIVNFIIFCILILRGVY